MKKFSKTMEMLSPYGVLLTGAFLSYTSRATVNQDQDTAGMIAGVYLMVLASLILVSQYHDLKKKTNNKNNQKTR